MHEALSVTNPVMKNNFALNQVHLTIDEDHS